MKLDGQGEASPDSDAHFGQEFIAAPDRVLVNAAALGERDAFEAIVLRYGPEMLRYARNMLSDGGAAEEVTQDAFLAAWKGLDTFRGDSSLRTWLFTLVSHKVVDHRRRRSIAPAQDWVFDTTPAPRDRRPRNSGQQHRFPGRTRRGVGGTALPTARRLAVARGGRDDARRNCAHSVDHSERGARAPGASQSNSERKDGGMAMTPDGSDLVLARASRSLRDQPVDARWIDISESIISRVRTTTRRTWPVDAEYPTAATDPERKADTLRVSDHVIRTAVRRALAGVHGAEPTAIDLYVDEHTCTGAHIDIVGVYGDDLQAVGDELAAIVLTTLTDLLGPVRELTRADVDVHVNDIDHAETR